MSAAILLALLCLVAWPPSAGAGAADGDSDGDAAATVGIRTANQDEGDDRGRFQYEIFPSGVMRDWVAISNYRDTPIKVRLLARDATTVTGSAFAVQPSADSPEDVGSWVTLKKQHLRLHPKTETIVPFEISVPDKATPGDHVGAILVSLLAREPKPEGGTVVVDHRVGLRVLLRVPGDLKPELSISDLEVTWSGSGSVLGRGDAVVSYTVSNTGNVLMSATQDIELSRTLGLPPVKETAPPIDEILPGGSLEVSQTIRHVLGTGPMKATVTLHALPTDDALASQARDVRSTQSFAAWPWTLLALLLGLLVILLTGGWYLRRHRAAKKARIAQESKSTGGSHAKGAGALVLVGVSLLGLLTPASAATPETKQWKAALSLAEGTAGQPFDILTSGGCPAPATNVVGFGYGNGFPKAGAVVIANGDAGVAAGAPFSAPLADNLNGLMALQPHPASFSGVYKFEVRCIEAMDPYTSYGDYVVAIKFDKPDHWKVLPALSTQHGPRGDTDPGSSATSTPAGTDGTPGSDTSQGSTTSGDGSGDETDPSLTKAQQKQAVADAAAATGVETTPVSSTPGGVPIWALLAAGFVLIVTLQIVLSGGRLRFLRRN